MKLEWSRLAIEDRDKIFDFIEQDDPRAAVSVDETIRILRLLHGAQLWPDDI